ncbi:zeta toxin family protein [Glutamicibacter sp. NPDC087344]|uniref:zeta toxin family protein n=1 Tax=Glutamicibacter sp. NPDC087344 TaxID=3363994 RepID=UPI0037F7BA82
MLHRELVAVEYELHSMTQPGGILHRDSSIATFHVGKPMASSRVRPFRLLLDEAMTDFEGDISEDGRGEIVFTAGPPGAGKSTMVRESEVGAPGWRVIDPDAIKVKLLTQIIEMEPYANLLARTLSDGHPLMVNELSSLVHNESVLLADRLIERCLEAHENIVIEGTFSWGGLPKRYLRLLNQYDYHAVTLIDVELDQESALNRTYSRWANGRMLAIQENTIQGGRYTPRGAVTSNYADNGIFSLCNKNAVDFFNATEAENFADLKLVVQQASSDNVGVVYRRAMGAYESAVPTYLDM